MTNNRMRLLGFKQKRIMRRLRKEGFVSLEWVYFIYQSRQQALAGMETLQQLGFVQLVDGRGWKLKMEVKR